MRILFNGYKNLLPGQKTHGYGGPHNFLELFIRSLKKTNHTFISVILHGKLKKLQYTEIKEGRNMWLLIEKYLNTKDTIKNGRLPKDADKTIREISEILKKYDPDVAFLNGFSVANWYLLQACSKLKIPIMSVHHGLWFKEVQDIKGVTDKTVNLTKKMEGSITELSDKEIFLNQTSRKEYEKFVTKVNKKKLEYIPLPFHGNFHQNISGIKKRTNGIKVGTVGRWDPIKNPAAYLNLAKEAKAQGLPWTFFSVTQINNRKNLRHIKKDYARNIKVIQQMPTGKLAGFYGKMNLMVLPSRYDVSPAVVMEAALQNVGTLISPNVGWVDTYNRFGMKNWVDDFKDPKKTINKIKSLIKINANGKFVSYIKKSHKSQTVMNKYIKTLESLIK